MLLNVYNSCGKIIFFTNDRSNNNFVFNIKFISNIFYYNFIFFKQKNIKWIKSVLYFFFTDEENFFFSNKFILYVLLIYLCLRLFKIIYIFLFIYLIYWFWNRIQFLYDFLFIIGLKLLLYYINRHLWN